MLSRLEIFTVLSMVCEGGGERKIAIHCVCLLDHRLELELLLALSGKIGKSQSHGKR